MVMYSKPTPYIFRMVNQTFIKLIRLIKDLKIHIHGIAYIITFTTMRNNVLDVYIEPSHAAWLSLIM
jgi:hypothetical protein